MGHPDYYLDFRAVGRYQYGFVRFDQFPECCVRTADFTCDYPGRHRVRYYRNIGDIGG